MNNTNLNKLAKSIYEQNKEVGWWDDPNRCIYTTLQLVSTELAEATEGERKNLMDDHLPHRKMGEVELADALIRVLDLGGRFGWKVSETRYSNVRFNTIRTIAGMHLVCNMKLSELAHAYWQEWDANQISKYYSQLIDSILQTSMFQGYDIEGAMYEKLKYNEQRLDHKRENRAKTNGKKF